MNRRRSCHWMVWVALLFALQVSYSQNVPPANPTDQTAHPGGRVKSSGGYPVQPFLPSAGTIQTSPRPSPRFLGSGVRHRVPQDFATIQAAIDASSDGDTVLISENTYLENIRFRGKAIVVGSLFLVDGDTTHIAKTIIDGSGSTIPDSGSVVYFIDGEDTTSVLCGMTIQHGTGTKFHFRIWRGDVWMTAGGGVLCDSAGPKLISNRIVRNRLIGAVPPEGGGIFIAGRELFIPTIILEGNRITDNYVEGTSSASGWGIGGGVCIAGSNARLVGNTFERDTVVSPVVALGGGVLIGSISLTNLPQAYIAGNVFQSNFAYTTGKENGAFGGGVLLEGTGEVTIQENLFVANRAAGAMAPHQWAMGGGLSITDGPYTGYGRKLIIRNQFIRNSISAGALACGGGLYIERTLASVCGNVFTDNVTEVAQEISSGGSGISLSSCSFRVENNVFTGNSSSLEGGALYVGGSLQGRNEQAVINNTFMNNHAALRGDGLRANLASNLVLMNNIFWSNGVSGGALISTSGRIAGVAYCDVKGGYPGVGNIDADPAFVEGDKMFHLSAESPCIESGIDSLRLGGVLYCASVSDCDGLARPMPTGTPPDIGAQEEQTTLVAFAHHLDVRPLTPRKQLDTVQIRATVENPHNHALTVTAYTKEFATENIQDSILLYNDGQHSDGLANDSTWGVAFVPTAEGIFGVSVRTADGAAGTTRESSIATGFATAGPVKFERYRYWEYTQDTLPGPGVDLYIRIGVTNLGTTVPLSGLIGRVSAIDSLVDAVTMARVTWGTLFPGDTTYYSTAVACLSIGYDRVGGDTVSFGLDLFHSGIRFWRDTIRVVLPPATPLRTLPPANATSISRRPIFSWAPVSNANKYHLELTTGDGFKIIVADTVILGDTTCRLPIELESEKEYRWQVSAGSSAGYGNPSSASLFKTGTTGVEQTIPVPVVYGLEQNYPNPFNPTTVVISQLPVASHVRLVIYDILGREVAVLVNEMRVAGYYQDTFDASGLASGIYFYHMKAGAYIQTKSMMLVR